MAVVIVSMILLHDMINRRAAISLYTYYYITILRTGTNTMTHIEGENVGIFCSVRNIYRLYVRTYCVPGILKELKNGLRCVFSVTRSRDPHSKKIRVPREPAATSLRVRRSDGTYTARFITKILSSSTRRRFYPQRSSEQAVVLSLIHI